jgi:uncharacterized RDD family membrane protein YckC
MARLPTNSAKCAVLFFRSLSRETVRSAKRTVIQTCTQCGAINQDGAEVCCFCEESLAQEHALVVSSAAGNGSAAATAPSRAVAREPESSWRAEVSHKLNSYRARRRGAVAQGDDASQSALPFGDPGVLHSPVSDEEIDDPLQTTLASAAARLGENPNAVPHAVHEPESEVQAEEIAEPTSRKTQMLEHLVIDVSRPPENDLHSLLTQQPQPSHGVAHPDPAIPVADLSIRRRAGMVDGLCLLVAITAVFSLYAGFGGKLLPTKLDFLVCAAALTLLYAQYFTLFTVMGGATPGMMFTGLRVVSFEGESPTPARLLWRSFGYLISGVTALLGFCWALADEDRLTWHDRISQTYIAQINVVPVTSADTLAQPGQHWEHPTH